VVVVVLQGQVVVVLQELEEPSRQCQLQQVHRERLVVEEEEELLVLVEEHVVVVCDAHMVVVEDLER
jgi:hypothetical protein